MLKRHKLMCPIFGMCIFLSKSAGLQTLYGKIDFSHMSLANEVKIVGLGVINDSILNKDIRVVGSLQSKRSQFLSDIHATGSDLKLDRDNVEGDVHVTNYVKPPKLYLNQSHIKGRVVFHGRSQGKVIMDKDSVIEKGVENGEVND